MLTRDDILKAKDRQTETVSVPEWGGDVLVAAMSGTQRDRFEAGIVNAEGKVEMRNMRAKLVAACVVDENGQAIFSDADIEALGGKSAAALERVVKVAQRINKMGIQDLEDLQGN